MLADLHPDTRDIITDWSKRGPLLASGASFRRERLAIILNREVETVSVPDHIERAAWNNIMDEGLCDAENWGSVTMIAREKVRWVLDNHPEAATRMVVGLDTVPLATTVLPKVNGCYTDVLDSRDDEVFKRLGDLDLAETKIARLLTEMGSISDLDLLAPISHVVFHKPRSLEKAADQIEELFRIMMQGYSSMRFIDAVLTKSAGFGLERKLFHNQDGEDWWKKQSHRKRWLLDYMYSRRYLATCVRVITAMAIHVPGSDTIETSTAFADVSFDTISNWVSWRYSPERLRDDLVMETIRLEQVAGVNPQIIPGGIDYSLIGNEPNLDSLLRGHVHDHGRVPDKPDIFKGLPTKAFECFLENLAFKAFSRKLKKRRGVS
ncbi:MAG: hypothetical protein HY817_01810 [Candidatus Abawacabacteria bacterium]|nr:hypothetical protein [Candidatus Abawacabacteria bacterium]